MYLSPGSCPLLCALSCAHPFTHSLVHFIFLMHFKVSCTHQYSNPQFTSFLNNIIVLKEVEYEFYVLNVSRLLSQRISDDSIILELIVQKVIHIFHSFHCCFSLGLLSFKFWSRAEFTVVGLEEKYLWYHIRVVREKIQPITLAFLLGENVF